MYLVSAFIKLSAAAAVLQYRGGDEAAISIMDTQRQSASGTQYCSDPIQSFIGAPSTPMGTSSDDTELYRDVGVGWCDGVRDPLQCQWPVSSGAGIRVSPGSWIIV